MSISPRDSLQPLRTIGLHTIGLHTVCLHTACLLAGVLLLSVLLLGATATFAGVGDGSVLSTTKIQDNGPDNQRFNIVIMGDGYTAAEMATYEARVQDFVTAFNASVNYAACGDAVNFYRVNIASDESGSDKPAACYDPAVAVDTYLDTRYCQGGTQRCIWSSNTGLVQSTATSATASWHYVVVLVNDSEHGGCAGSGLTFNSTGTGFERTVLHEIGHALGGLADEYEYGSADSYAGGEPGSPNVTTETVRQDIKWFDLIAATTPIVTWNRPTCSDVVEQPPAAFEDVIGLYEGARYHRCDIYRPDRSCLMRVLSADFCTVCQRRVQQVMSAHYVGSNLSITPWGYYQDPKVSPFWQTPDIWVDNDADGTQEPGEPSIGLPDNRLFARVTNSSGAASGSYQVRFSYVPYTGVIDLDNAQIITTVNRPSLAAGTSEEIEVAWPLDAIPPEFAGIDHFCVIVEILADECQTYDNRAQNNFASVPTAGPAPAPFSIMVRNVLDRPATGRLEITPNLDHWRVTSNVGDLDGFPLAPREEKRVEIELTNTRWNAVRGQDEGQQTSGRATQDFDITFSLDEQILGGVSAQVVRQPASTGLWSLSLHLGRTIPQGDLDPFFDDDVSLMLDVERRLDDRFSLVGMLGYHAFAGASPFVDDAELWSLSLGLKYHLTSTAVRPYVSSSLGYYIPDGSGSSDPGASLGAGVDWLFGPHWTFEAGVIHHAIFASGDIEFTVPHVGIIHRF